MGDVGLAAENFDPHFVLTGLIARFHIEPQGIAVGKTGFQIDEYIVDIGKLL